MDVIKVLLVDDHSIIRNGIKLMLKKNTTIKVVAEANSGVEAIDYLEKNAQDIDVVLMDIDMPGLNGIDTTKVITKEYKNINVLALSMHIEEKYIKEMLDAGAAGYILKQASIEELNQAVENVAQGKKYFSNEVSTTMINALMHNGKGNEKDVINVLSAREKEVLSLIALGKTNKEVGEKLFISARTVESHRRKIMEKLELNNTAELIRYAIENNMMGKA
ncbi:MAG: DNA-binding response regulator [Flavobacteriales bacterium CG18_big_fil_WC_8_21_14_2_50_32_9]|nr:MAG: DNA-binding response regulator [Flavobacteriales bacterium CG18_big_fil_WC_8_21_14_2_50_32_9]